MPGVFAAGDVRHGSMNRVASAVGEGSIAIRLVHELFAAEQLRGLGWPGRAALRGPARWPPTTAATWCPRKSPQQAVASADGTVGREGHGSSGLRGCQR